MYLPESYKSFSGKYPDVLESFKHLGKTCRECGPLKDKELELAKLGISVGVNSRGAVMSAVRKALSKGITRDEIQQVILLSITTNGFPNMIAAMGWANEVLEKQQ